MGENAIIYRLNVIIVLLLILIGILLWPLFSGILLWPPLSSLVLLAFLVVTGGMVAWALWGLIDAVW